MIRKECTEEDEYDRTGQDRSGNNDVVTKFQQEEKNVKKEKEERVSSVGG